jgi:predicted XRE-type DNA-binding protein
MTTTRKNWKSKVARDADELADLLDLSPVEAQLMKTKAEISSIAVKAIDQSEMTVNEIVKHSGVARSKVSAVKNGATMSVSIDLLVKIIAATGTSIRVRVA